MVNVTGAKMDPVYTKTDTRAGIIRIYSAPTPPKASVLNLPSSVSFPGTYYFVFTAVRGFVLLHSEFRCQVQLCPPCNTVRSGHFCLCNHVRGYAKTVRRDVRAEASVRAIEPTYVCSMNIHVILWLQLEPPTAEHFPSHSWHALILVKKMANVFRRPRAFNLLQGRFCTGRM